MRRRPNTLQQGLTLLELLLTVVIFSLVISVFAQAVFQISLFERASARSMGNWQQQWHTGFSLDDNFLSLAFAPEANDPLAQGNARSFSAWWVEQAGSTIGRPVPVVLQLKALEGTPGSNGTAPVPWGLFAEGDNHTQAMLARWDMPVRFEYVDATGAAHTTWPPLNTGSAQVTDEALPRAVRVLDEQDRIVHQWLFAGVTQAGLVRAASGTPFGMGAAP